MRYIEFKKYNVHLRNGESDKPYILSEDGKELVGPEQFCWLLNDGPPHDHNYDWKDNLFLEQYLHKFNSFTEDMEVDVVVETICPNYGGKHIGKDCSCKTGFIEVPVLYKEKIIIDMNKLLETKGYTRV